MWPRAFAEEFRKNDFAVLAAEAPIEVVESAPNPDGSIGRWLNKKFAYRDSTGRRYVGGVGVDITARIDAEAELRKSEQRLRGFYNLGLLGLVYWNMNGQIVDANDKFLEMVGYERDDLTAGRIDWRQMTPPEFAHLDERAVADLKATGVNSVPYEREFNRKDGARLPVLIAGAMLDEARFEGVAFVVDITDRKQAEQRALESKFRLEAALSAMTDAVFISDAEGRLILFNDAFVAFHRFASKAECFEYFLDYLTIFQCLNPDDQDVPPAQWPVSRALQGETVAGYELGLRRRDTGETWLGSYSFAPIRNADGAIVGAVLTARDVTEKRKS